MAEEVIRMQGSTETDSEQVRAAETMGTVISMKPAAGSGEQQKLSEAGTAERKDAEPQDLSGGIAFAEPERAGEAGRYAEAEKAGEAERYAEAERTGEAGGYMEPEHRGGAGDSSFERPVKERRHDFDFSSGVHFTEPEFPKKDSDKEKRQISDFFHFRKNIEGFTREDWILSRIPAEDLMEYLTMEQKRNEMLQKAKEVKEKRIFTTIQIALSMAAIVGVVALLKDNPTVLVNILYITGIVIALWIWRGKQDK